MSEAELVKLHEQGIVTGETLVWREGMAGWHPFMDTPEFEDLFDDDASEATVAVEVGAMMAAMGADPDDDDDDDDDGPTLMLEGEALTHAFTAAKPNEYGVARGYDGPLDGSESDGERTSLAPPPRMPPPRMPPPRMPPPPRTPPPGPPPPRTPPPGPPPPRTPPAPPPPLEQAPAPPVERVVHIGAPAGPPVFREETGSVPLAPPPPGGPAPGDTTPAPEIPVGLAEMLEPETLPPAGFPVPPELSAPPAGLQNAPTLDKTPSEAREPATLRKAVVAVVLLALGGGGALGVLWWQKRPLPHPAPVATPAAAPVRVAPPDAAVVEAPDAAPKVRVPDAAAPAPDAAAIPDAKAPDAKAPDANAPVVAVAPRPVIKPKPKPGPKPVSKPKPTPKPAVTPPKPKPANDLPTTLSRQDMLSVLNANRGRLRTCFGEGASPSTMSVAVTISRTGKVGSARVLTSKIRRAPETAKCIEGQVKSYVFKPFNGETMRLTLPLKP